MRLSNIYQINIDRKDGNKANVDIRYRKGKCRILHSFDAIETSFGLTLMKKEDAGSDEPSGNIEESFIKFSMASSNF